MKFWVELWPFVNGGSYWMIIITFFVYFIIFSVFFYGPEFRKKERLQVSKLLVVPALLAIVMVLLTVIKVYFIYKFLVLLFLFMTFLLSYWQWGEQIRYWWK